MKKKDLIKAILHNTNHGSFVNPDGGVAWAPSNVALCKYWGKRDTELNLPCTSSLSVSLGNKGAFTRINSILSSSGLTRGSSVDDGCTDKYIVNGNSIGQNSKFAIRLKKFLDLFRPDGVFYSVDIKTNVPIAAGFASSACGFASLILALNDLYKWNLDKKELSILARMGSGSACRSIDKGFVEWNAGKDSSGIDSYGVKLDYEWPELRVGMLSISNKEKPISSTEAMKRTVKTSPFYDDWINTVNSDLVTIKKAIAKKDFNLLGETAENNSIAMHALMGSSDPVINYSLAKTEETKAKVQELRASGVPVFFTQDAGPNLQLLFLADVTEKVLQEFPDLKIVVPFDNEKNEEIILVDKEDNQIGTGEKFEVHAKGELHRAFSVFILRERGGVKEVLLQQRAPVKYHSANLWTNTCCGHPRPGEGVIEAAKRRLKEEMGFTSDLEEIDVFNYKYKFNDIDLYEHEVDHVLVGYSDLEDIPYELTEVQDIKWMVLDDLKKDVKNNPQKYTVWLGYALEVIDITAI